MSHDHEMLFLIMTIWSSIMILVNGYLLVTEILNQLISNGQCLLPLKFSGAMPCIFLMLMITCPIVSFLFSEYVAIKMCKTSTCKSSWFSSNVERIIRHMKSWEVVLIRLVGRFVVSMEIGIYECY